MKMKLAIILMMMFKPMGFSGPGPAQTIPLDQLMKPGSILVLDDKCYVSQQGCILVFDVKQGKMIGYFGNRGTRTTTRASLSTTRAGSQRPSRSSNRPSPTLPFKARLTVSVSSTPPRPTPTSAAPCSRPASTPPPSNTSRRPSRRRRTSRTSSTTWASPVS